MGDWYDITFSASTRDDALRAPVSVMDNVVVRYGGEGSSGCNAYAEVQVEKWGRVMISRSEFTDSLYAGLNITSQESGVGVATVTTSRFTRSRCGPFFDGGDISNSVFEDMTANRSMWALNPQNVQLTGNLFRKPAAISRQDSREELDARNNAFLEGITIDSNRPPADVSRNWWGWPVPDQPPWSCYSSSSTYIPDVKREVIKGSCNDYFSITGWRYKVIPALQQAPPVPKAGVDGVPEPALSVPESQTYGGGAGTSSAYGYRPVGMQADPVNTATGSFVTSAVDAVLPAVGLPLSVARSYDSASGAAGPLGRGWSFGYDIRLVEDADGAITLWAGDGQRLRYTRAADGYMGAPGVTATLAATDGGGWTLTTRDQLRHEFDAAGRLTALRDAAGQGVDLAYDPAGRLTTVSGSGRSLSLTWDPAAERVTRVGLSDGRWVGYGYTDGLLTSVRDLSGAVTTYAYDADGRLTSITSPSGRRVTKQVYDDVTGRVTDQWDGRDNHSTFGWDPATETATMTDPRGGVWRDVYRGNVLIKRVDPVGGTTSYEYDSALQLIAATNPRGIRSVFGYNDAGDLISHSGPTKSVTSVYDNQHRVIASVNARGVEVNYGYDAAGNLTSVTRPNPNDSEPWVTRYDYTEQGLPAAVTDPLGNITSYAYNTHGDLISETSPEGRTTTYTRDSAGRVSAVTDPRGNVTGANPADYTTRYTYDDADRGTSIRNPLGHTTNYTYDTDGRLTRVEDPKGRASTYTYNADGHVTAVQGPDPAVTATTASYDANGNPLTTVDPMGRTTSYTYDLANRITKATSPIGTYSLGYNAGGNLTSITTPTGAKTQLLYDTAGRLTKIDYPTGTTDVAYYYDANGNRTAMTDAAGTVTYSYDRLDRPTTITRGATTFRYSWDAVGNMTGLTYPDGTNFTYGFDADGLLTSASSGATTLARYGYNPGGLLTSTERADGSTSSRSYDRAGQLTRITDQTPSKTLLDETYTLDATGNPTAIRHADATVDTFRYDVFDRLTKACFNDTLGSVLGDQELVGGCEDTSADFIEWAYDTSGNRTRETRPAGSTSYSYNPAGQLTTVTAPTGATTSYGYSANGNMTKAGADTYTYNNAGRITNSTVDGVASTYTYDGDGRRLTTTSAGTTRKWLWGPLSYDLALEQDGNNATLRRYVYGVDRLSMTVPGTAGAPGVGEFFYHTDALGSVRSVTDTSGAEQWQYSYEPYGAPRTSAKLAETAPANPMGWVGEYTEPGGTTHLRARQYDIDTGRFNQPDPANAVPAGATYTYANANPLTHTDPLGLWPEWGDVLNVVKNIATTTATVAGGGALILGATGIGAPVAAVLGGVAVGAGIVTAGISAYQAWDTCTSNTKGSCGAAIVTAAIDTAGAIPGAGAGAIGRHLAKKTMFANSVLDTTPAGRQYSWHYLNDTGPVRKIPGSVVDEAIDHGNIVKDLSDRTVFFDPKNNVTVVKSTITGKIMSVRRGTP